MKLCDVPKILIKIPKLSLVVLIGPSGSHKTTFARRHFLPSEVLSPDRQHRHRLCLRRQADGLALPGTRIRLGTGREDLQ
jgi:hypothetical protein